MPAKDELFWEAVNKKLEPISQGQNALPAVMQVSVEDPETEAGPSGLNASLHGPKTVGPVGGDGSTDAQAGADDSDGETGAKGIDADVPLKFKATSNFGAPFGPGIERFGTTTSSTMFRQKLGAFLITSTLTLLTIMKHFALNVFAEQSLTHVMIHMPH
ncbi:hypothetical protein NM208_g16818 [Fusarium decemcellulare]|uniref:Uncharacterized protein n=1 Tax=Fusarium decemcellulare TaxID=57161 RepID=A0ACC1R958_9HYPO|nr:hypothetical protein NM208_g16818 [Fusarium decemcellulare]